MQTAELSVFRHLVQLGVPLPFGVRDAARNLLLARGQVIADDEQLGALLARGALVDLAEVRAAQAARPAAGGRIVTREQVRQASRAELPGVWSRCLEEIGRTLTETPDTAFRTALDDAARPVLSLVERDPDLAIFQVLRQAANADIAYGVRRSVQGAITAHLVAQRLAWDEASSLRAFKVALTANVSMLELQGQLARQLTPPTPAQRHELQTHPMRSVRLLEQAGVDDAAWLAAVLRHHEEDGGHGYPAGHGEAGELASLVRRADVYTSKLAARNTRDAMAADLAGRQMFMQDAGHPMTAALVKEFGIYPPGAFVRLASGETAVVVGRGPVITAPVVLVLSGAAGRALAHPERRETTSRAHAVVGVIADDSFESRLPLDRLLALVTA